MEEWEILDEEAFEQFRESGGSLFDLADFTFDYQDELDALAEVDFTPSDLTSNSIKFFGTSADGTHYDVTFSGDGISPNDSYDSLRDALANGSASGTINGMSVDAGGEEILSLDVNDNGYTLQSGAQELEFEGAFSNTLNDFSGQAAGIFDIEAALGGTSTGAGLGLAGLFSFFQPSEDESGISITLRDGGDELAGISFGGDSLLTLSSGTYSIAFNGEFPDFNDLVMNPRLELFDSNGNPLESADGASGSASIMDYSPGSDGTYYLAVSGVEADDTGDYQLVAVGPATEAITDPVETGNAAADTSTDEVMVVGDTFSGAIDPEGDSDWIEIDLEANPDPTYNFFVSAVPEDFNFGLDSIVVSESGEPIARLDNIPTIQDIFDGLEDLLDDLDLPIPDLTGPNGWASGDPHLQTLDGVGYDFHAVGEYVLARGTASNFEVQARMEPVAGGSNASLISAVAARAGNGDEVMVDATDADPLSVNGGVVTLADGETRDVGEDRIYRDGDTYTMVFAGDDGAINDGDSQISVAVRDERVDVNLQISEALGGNLEGLLGDGDGDPSNDIALADGSLLERPLAYEDVYGQYRDDWRVDAEGDSLFTYDSDESLADFYDADYPADTPSLSDFDDSKIADARAVAEDGGLTPGTLEYDNAVFDYLLTGDESYIDSARETSGGGGAPAGALAQGQNRASLNLSVEKFDGDALDGAQAGFAPDGATAGILAQAAGSAGGYTFSLAEGASGRVEVVREHQSGDPESIDVSDALNVLRLAVELEPGWGEAADENFVAADIDQDGAVTVSDALEVLRAAVDLDSDVAPRWVGFEEGTDFSGQSKKSVDVETGVSIETLSDGDSIDMTAILLGNMEQVV